MDNKPNLEIQNAFRATFGTPQGVKVLAILADVADYFSYVNPESTDMQLANLAGRRAMIQFIIERIGLKDNESIIRALLAVPVVAPEEDPIEEEEDL